jgi:hypothetical protein
MPEPIIDPTTSAISAPRESFWSDEFEGVMMLNQSGSQTWMNDNITICKMMGRTLAPQSRRRS